MIYVWAAPRAAASDSLAQELRCSPIMIYMHASPSPSSPRPLLHTTTGPICCVAAARALGCLVQLGAAGTDPSSGQSSGAAAGPTASSAGGRSMAIPHNPPSIPLVPRLSWQSIPCWLQMSTGPVRFSGGRRRGLFVLGHPSCHHCLQWGAQHERSRRARTQLSTRRRVPEGKAKVRGL